MTAEPLVYADVFAFATKGFYFFDADDWAAALPGKNAVKAVSVTTDFSYQIHNQPDYEATVGYKFIGDFKKSGGTWSGTIEKVQFLRDGDVFGVIDINSGVDISRVVNVGGSGLIWNELTVTGVRGTLTREQDYFNGSLGDDILNLGAGHDNVNASRGNDVVRGGGGHDLIDGYDGNDTLFGGGGNDQLWGKGGDDRLFGQAGIDTFASDGQGNNVWTGGKGADLFQPSGVNYDGSHRTKVTDFTLRQGDKLDLSEFSALLYNQADEIRYIGKRAFSGEAGDVEIQMRNGMVSIDDNGDGKADWGVLLEGLGTIKASNTDWILLPDWWDFS
ncbi:MAG: hypothetical protein KDK24_04080 [Pseudooceanicola sp.]|nr:hypothetical protein [Pseudooceanicola sp.]